jgi:hypothetical protein
VKVTTGRFSRRTVLKGAGVALGLPWLESLARGQAPAPRRTFVGFFFPCGTANYWRPAAPGVGDGWALSPILEPLASLKSRVTVGNYGPFGGHIEPSHSQLTAAFLTCTKAKAGPPSTLGVSVDQVIAKAMARRTRIPSLQVGLSTLDSSPYGLPPEFSRSISWASPTEPLYKIVSPRRVFDRLVAANPSPGMTDVFAASRRAAHKSVLDYVAGHTTSVRATLGRADQLRMDEFLASVRSLEKRVDAGAVGGCVVPPRPTEDYAVAAVPADYNRNTHADLMIDLVVMALACDLTRVVSFMLDDSRSDFVYDFLEDRTFGPDTTSVKTSGLHGLSESTGQSNGWATINRWFVEKLARFCGRLDATSEGTGTLLDASTVWFGSECHNGNEDGLDLPVLYVGGGGGRLKTDRVIDFASTTRQTERLANVYLTFLRGVFDLPDMSFGTSLGGGPSPGSTVPSNAYGGGTELVPEILA